MRVHKNTSHSTAFLLLVPLLCSLMGLASGKNLLSQLGNIMTDNPGGSPTVDYDAATGTVQDTTAKKDSTCDGQLASALVKANDLASATEKERDDALAKHKDALETIGTLAKDLAQINAELVKERETVGELKETMTKSLQMERDRSQDQLEAVKDQAKKELEAVRDEKDTIITSLTKESAEELASAKDLAEKQFEDLKTEKDEMISSLEAKLKMSSEELQATMKSELEKAKLDKETKVAEITANRDSTVAELTESMEKAAKNAAEVLQKTEEEAKAKLTAVEADFETRLATLTQNMEKAAKEAEELLKSTKDEHEELLSERNQKIKNLEEYKTEISEKKTTIEQLLEEANAEISHWRRLHSQRSYCNMTHIANDVYDISASAYRQASDKAVVMYAESKRIASAHVSDGLEYSNRLINEQVEEHWPSIQPYYEEHISNNYQTHVKPHMQKHVFPMVRQASDKFHEVVVPLGFQAIEEGKNSFHAKITPVFEKYYNNVVRLYADYCRSSLQEFLKASQELEILKENPPPAFLIDSWETSCANPHESLSTVMHGALALFVVIFHRRLLRLAWWIFTSSLSLALRLSLSLLIRLTPLRFIFLRKSVAECIDESPPQSPPAITKNASTDSLMKTFEDEEIFNDDEDENGDTNGEVAVNLY